MTIKKTATNFRIPLLLKILVTTFLIVGALGYVATTVLGFSLTDNDVFKLITYPLDKRACENRGGTYNLNYSLNSYYCYVKGNNDFESNPNTVYLMKPVIYLYPPKQTAVKVTLNYTPGFSVTYPTYDNGWEVTAYPGGKIINKSDNKEYSYLYWEGNPDPSVKYDLSSGFVVKSENTVSFLQSKLSELGLTPKEYNEFIVYWYPKMKSNPYNLVHFTSQSEYDAKAVLKVTPEPDSLLRVFMVYKPISKLVAIEPQQLKAFQRTGFSVVEWGGSELP